MAAPPVIDIEALALVGARIELHRILDRFPALRAELPAKIGRPRKAPTPTPAPHVHADGHTHTCEHCDSPFTPDPRQASRARVCARKACKRWLHNGHTAARRAALTDAAAGGAS